MPSSQTREDNPPSSSTRRRKLPSRKAELENGLFFPNPKKSQPYQSATFPSHLICNPRDTTSNEIIAMPSIPAKSKASKPPVAPSVAPQARKKANPKAQPMTTEKASKKLAKTTSSTKSAVGDSHFPRSLGKRNAHASPKMQGENYSDKSPAAVPALLQVLNEVEQPGLAEDILQTGILPNQALTLYRKAGSLDLIAYWLRKRARRFTNILRQALSPQAKSKQLDILKRENAQLRRQLELLRTSH